MGNVYVILLRFFVVLPLFAFFSIQSSFLFPHFTFFFFFFYSAFNRQVSLFAFHESFSTIEIYANQHVRYAAACT